jgi:Macrocin-O-methyltransferase (TylF)
MPRGNALLNLYTDLLKKTLTGTLYHQEPDADSENEIQFVSEFIKHYMKGPAVTMLPLVRLNNLEACIADVIRNDVPGDLIETGVWRGGSTIFMRALLKAFGVTDRKVWVADSFEGLPEPDADKFPIEADAHHGAVLTDGYKHFAASLEEVQANFRAYGMLDEQVQFLKGWFCDTLPTAPIRKLAVMRLDGDYYESTMDGLKNLYDKLSIGGYAIIDDYGESEWTYCKKAVDDFRLEHKITEPMVRVDSKCYFWRRER